MPGLIDNHVHVFMNGSTQAEMLGNVDKPEILHDMAAKQAEKMLLPGFTSVRDVGGPVFEVKQRIDSGKSVGLRIYPSGAIILQTSGTAIHVCRAKNPVASSAQSRKANCSASTSLPTAGPTY